MNIQVLKLFEPNAISFEELSKSYLVHTSDKKRVMLSKDLVLGIGKECFTCGQSIRLIKHNGDWLKFNPKDYSEHIDDDYHEHRGYTITCWECGLDFCRACMGEEGNMSDQYCGC